VRSAHQLRQSFHGVTAETASVRLIRKIWLDEGRGPRHQDAVEEDLHVGGADMPAGKSITAFDQRVTVVPLRKAVGSATREVTTQVESFDC
jgi:hypothetical protein